MAPDRVLSMIIYHNISAYIMSFLLYNLKAKHENNVETLKILGCSSLIFFKYLRDSWGLGDLFV